MVTPDMATRRSAREVRADDTRRRLFAAAAELFAAHGFGGTTVDEIARRAGVAKGTFFLHFATKDAVVTEIVAHQVRRARKAREAVHAARGTPVEALAAVVRSLGEQAAASRGVSRAVLAATLENPRIGGDVAVRELHAEMVADVRAAQRRRLLAAGDAAVIASSLLATYLGAGVVFMSGAGRLLMEVLEPLLAAALAGLAPTKTRRS
jgi:AcrR family transcriptional regulator